MKSALLVLTTAAVCAAPLAAAAATTRQPTPSGRMSLTLEQDISTASAPSIAGRSFAFELDLAPDPSLPGVAVTVVTARASYTAHGMAQRLGARPLTGRRFPLLAGGDAWAASPDAAEAAPPIDLGPMVPGGLAVDALLAAVLPASAPATLERGTAWTTERTVRSLEGWAWGSGPLTSRHRVTGVERHGATTVVTVESEGEAALASGPAEGSYEGTLRRTVRWSFEAASGRLLSLALEQTSAGASLVGQGRLELTQTSRIELVPSS